MRISRIPKIRGHRVFRDFAWPAGLHPFGQFNLIYGWNGSGKTALSALFRHLQDRTTLTEGDVEFEFDEATKIAGADLSSATLPPVRVFNRDFVAATISVAGSTAPIYFLISTRTARLRLTRSRNLPGCDQIRSRDEPEGHPLESVARSHPRHARGARRAEAAIGAE